jgi:hypothetical protein
MKRKERIYKLVDRLPLSDCDAVLSFSEYLVDRSERKPHKKFLAKITRLRVVKPKEIIEPKRTIMSSIQENMDEYNSKPDYMLIAFKKKMNHIRRWGW